jgi:cation diffusion facilitator family transporter
MDDEERNQWSHDHTFGQDARKAGEKRTLWVIALTAIMMVVEIAAGILYGSMALLADGLHMASHTAALGISFFAYIYARRNARNPKFSFGTGKVNALGGFTGALLLALFALGMVWESCERLISPVAIAYNQAILVAIVGLLVNGASVFILGGGDGAGDGHGHSHAHTHSHSHSHSHSSGDDAAGQGDQNLRSAYLHVMADALTSILAIFALLAAKYHGLQWMDPAMGIVGAFLVARWSVGLIRTTSHILLDHQVGDRRLAAVKEAIEKQDDTYVTDLHVWSIGPDIYAAEIMIVAGEPLPPHQYKDLVPEHTGIVHVICEVHARAPSEARQITATVHQNKTNGSLADDGC